MIPNEVAILAERIDRLEKENIHLSRRLNRAKIAFFSVVFLLGLAGVLGASRAPNVVRADSFELVDGTNSVRAKLYIRTSGIGTTAPTLDFFDQNAKPRIRLTAVDGDEDKCGGGSPSISIGDKLGFVGNAFVDECKGKARLFVNGKAIAQ